MTDTTPVEALREALPIMEDCLKALGDCDHDVGICNCDMKRSIASMRAALASLAVSPEPQCARVELVVALHTLASHYENSLGGFGDDDEGRRKAEGDIAHAMRVAAKHNQNGPSCALGHPVSAVPPLSEAARQEQSLGAPASPSGSAGSAPSPSVSALRAPILGAEGGQ